MLHKDIQKQLREVRQQNVELVNQHLADLATIEGLTGELHYLRLVYRRNNIKCRKEPTVATSKTMYVQGAMCLKDMSVPQKTKFLRLLQLRHGQNTDEV